MNRKVKLIVVLSAILIISIAVNGCSTKKDQQDQNVGSTNNSEPVEENDEENIDDIGMIKLPDFNLKDLEGNQVSSDIFRDYDMTIVSIWQSTCGPCIEELEALNVIYNEYKDKDVNVLGISVDNVEVVGEEGVKELVETLELEFTNVIADEDYLIKLIDYVQGTPTAFILGKEGELLTEPRVGSNGTENDIKDFKNIIEEIQKD